MEILGAQNPKQNPLCLPHDSLSPPIIITIALHTYPETLSPILCKLISADINAIPKSSWTLYF